MSQSKILFIEGDESSYLAEMVMEALDKMLGPEHSYVHQLGFHSAARYIMIERTFEMVFVLHPLRCGPGFSDFFSELNLRQVRRNDRAPTKVVILGSEGDHLEGINLHGIRADILYGPFSQYTLWQLLQKRLAA